MPVFPGFRAVAFLTSMWRMKKAYFLFALFVFGGGLAAEFAPEWPSAIASADVRLGKRILVNSELFAIAADEAMQRPGNYDQGTVYVRSRFLPESPAQRLAPKGSGPSFGS